MAIGGAFLGGGAEIVPAGFCKLELEILTEDRNNLVATFSIKGTSTYTVTAGADGRAVYTVPAGQTYTVSVNTTGYDNIASQTVVAESGTVRYVRFEAFEGRVKRSGDTMTGDLSIVKTNPQILLKDSSHALADRVTANTNVTNLVFHDKNGKYSGGLIHRWDASGLHRVLVEAIGENGTLSQVGPMVSATGEKYGFAPSWSVGTNDNSDKILTIKMANSLPSLVHSTGNETIAGEKKFTAPITIEMSGKKAPFVLNNTTDLSTTSDTFDDFVIKQKGTTRLYARYNATSSAHNVEIIVNDVSGTKIGTPLKFGWNATKGAYAEAITTPSNATGQEIATADWSIGKFVQKSGDTMSGALLIQKTTDGYPLKLEYTSYDSGLILKRKGVPIDAEVTDLMSGGKIYFQDEGDVNFGVLATQKHPNYNHISLFAYRGGKPQSLQLINAGDTGYATAPSWSVGTNDNSDKILTIKMANSLPSLVHSTGNETIAGTKTFTSSLVMKSPSYDIGNNPEGWRYISGYLTQDSVGNTVFNIQTRFTQQAVETRFQTPQIIGDGTATTTTPITIRSDGTTTKVLCVSTPTNATSNEIATANWVNTKLATRAQKLTLNGTITDGVIVTNDIQANDTVFVSITTPSDISPITYAVDIPSTVENAMLVRSSSHITEKSDGKLYSIDIYAQYRKTAWHIGIIQRGITDGGVSNPAVVSFYGHILRAG